MNKKVICVNKLLGPDTSTRESRSASNFLSVRLR